MVEQFDRLAETGQAPKFVERLAAGDDVTSVSLDLGYRSPSAFIAMFKRVLGATPGRYVRGLEG